MKVESSQRQLPYNTNELVKGFIYIHRRILGTSFNIRYLKDKPKTHMFKVIWNKINTPALQM